MAKLDKLKGKIVEKKANYNQCAKAINTTVTTFCNKINNKSNFTVEEVLLLSEFLGLSNEEKIDIFLS